MFGRYGPADLKRPLQRPRREPRMNLEFSAEDNAFRDEVRAFIAENYPEQLRGKQDEGDDLTKDDYLSWHKVLAKKGWVAPSWPKALGGTDWTSTQKYIWSEELARADALPVLPFGVVMVAPVIYTFGTPEQKERFLPKIYNGEEWWCQGYSEPGAGSDLANGQKTWTTLAQFADWGFFLVRTDPTAKIQEGISFLLIDMKTPGIEVRRITTLEGGHEVNEVWLENVKVPVENRVYEENKGWTCAKFLLAHERSGIAGVARSKRGVEKIRDMASNELGDDGKPLIQDADFKRKVAELEIDLTALEFTELRTLASESQQRLTELALEAAGPYGAPYLRDLGDNAKIGPDYAVGRAGAYFNTRKTSIYGGSNEIQRNIIAKMVLGL